MKQLISKQILRFMHAGTGILHAIRFDTSFKIQVIGGIVFLSVYTYFFSPFTQLEILFLMLAWALVLITELQNSSFEEALDKLHPEHHERIGKSKDMASGAVLIAGLFALLVSIVIALF